MIYKSSLFHHKTLKDFIQQDIFESKLWTTYHSTHWHQCWWASPPGTPPALPACRWSWSWSQYDWSDWLGCKWSFPEYLIQIWSNVSQLHLSNYIVAGTRLTKWLQIKVNQHLLHLFLTFIVMIRIILHWLFNNMDIKAWLWFIFEWLEICKHGMLCILSKCVLE